MLQKLLGVCFFATILVLSYVATLHIVTNRVDALHHNMVTPAERTKNLSMGNPVLPLRPISDHMPVGQKKYPVKKYTPPPAKVAKVAKVSKMKKVEKMKKKPSRSPASKNKEKHKNKRKRK